MARSYAIVAVLALVAASLLVTPAAAANQYTIASTNLLIDQPVSGIYSGTFVTASGLNSTSNGALQLLGVAADQYITTLLSGSATPTTAWPALPTALPMAPSLPGPSSCGRRPTAPHTTAT